MRLVLGHDKAIAEWVGHKLKTRIPEPYVAMGWIDAEGTLRIGALFSGYVPGGNIDLSLAASGRFYRGVLREIAHYAFEQASASRITARTRRDNERACKQLLRAGFKKEADCKAYFGRETDALQFRLLKGECKRY